MNVLAKRSSIACSPLCLFLPPHCNPVSIIPTSYCAPVPIIPPLHSEFCRPHPSTIVFSYHTRLFTPLFTLFPFLDYTPINCPLSTLIIFITPKHTQHTYSSLHTDLYLSLNSHSHPFHHITISLFLALFRLPYIPIPVTTTLHYHSLPISITAVPALYPHFHYFCSLNTLTSYHPNPFTTLPSHQLAHVILQRAQYPLPSNHH